MCFDENGAPHAVRYLNAQLQVLHGNAKKCYANHAQDCTDENKQFWVLAAFRVRKPGTNDCVFDAKFETPKLDFVCNHDAVLEITLVDSTIVARTGSASVQISLPNPLKLTYRLGFETRNMTETNQKSNGSAGTVPLIILNIKEAQLLRTQSDDLRKVEPDVQNALSGHMKEYFKLLHKTGNHILYSLPQFGQRAPSMSIDFSLNSHPNTKYQFDNSSDIYHDSINKLNAYFFSAWLKSALLAHGNAGWEAKCLATLDSSWLAESDRFGVFFVEFDAPWIEFVCEREVIVYFTVRKIKISFAGSRVIEKEGWRIAIVVNVDVDSTKAKGKLVVDLAGGRYDHGASTMTISEGEATIMRDFLDAFIKFITKKYLLIFNGVLQYVMGSIDIVETITTVQEDSEGTWRLIDLPGGQGPSPRRDTVQRAKMFGFDQIVAISQGSINSQFATLASHTKSIFRKWSYQDTFEASFKPLTMCLMPQNRAIVWVNIHDGYCRLPIPEGASGSDGAVKSTFSGWCLAFEVELKLCSQEKLEGATSETYKMSSAYQEHGTHSDRELQHVYLDLRNAEYLHEYSRVDSQSNSECRIFLKKLQVVLEHLTSHYFAAICKDAFHVVASIPVWKAGDFLPSHAFTSVNFQVYSRDEVVEHHRRLRWGHASSGEEPILVIFGMTDMRPLAPKPLECSTGWVVPGNNGFSHGTISISKRVFVEDHLLRLLSSVIEQTAFLPPTLPDKLSEYYALTLLRWPRGHSKSGDQYLSHWKTQGSSNAVGTLKYVWGHGDRSTRECRGNIQTMRSGINCENSQYLELLKDSVKQGAPGLRLKIGGKTELTIEESTKTDMPLHQATCSVEWSITVVVETARGTSVKIYVEDSSGPTFSEPVENTHVEDATLFRSPKEMLQEVFPAEVDLTHFLDQFDSDAFEGAWRYCYPLATPYYLATPVFNDDGDLLFELRRHRGSSHLRSGAAQHISNGGSAHDSSSEQGGGVPDN